MPSQHEIEERIKLEIGKKIDAGDFKTTKDPNSKSAIWKVFASITNEYGQIFNGYIYCTECGKVFRYDGQRYSIALYKHECLSGEEQTQSCRKTDEMPEDLMKEKMEDILIPVWQMFDLTFMEGERTVEARITCRQCNIQLDYDYNASNVTQQKIHKCLDLGESHSLKVMPYQHEVEDMIRLEIINKINAGHFKLIPNPNDKSLVWRIFALIATTKYSIISGYVCCTKCSKLLKRDGIHHHGCHQLQKNLKDRANNVINILDGGNIMLPGGKIQIERKKEKRKVDISEKLNNSEYKLTMDRNSQNEIKNIFATIIKPDGSCVKGYLYCTKCRSILKCESWNSRSFKSHPCSKHLYTQNSSTSTLDSSEHCSIKRQHSGEKFDEVDTDSDDDQGKSGIKKQRMGMEGSFISNQVNNDKIKSDYHNCDDDTSHNDSGGSYSICVKEEYNYPNAATPETNVNDDMMCQMDDNSKHLVSIKQEMCVKEEYNYTEHSSSTNDNSSQLVSIKRELDDNA